MVAGWADRWWSPATAHLGFNANNPTVQKLLDDPDAPLAADTIRALHIVGLLLARTQVPVHGANLFVHAIAGLTGTAVEVVPA